MPTSQVNYAKWYLRVKYFRKCCLIYCESLYRAVDFEIQFPNRQIRIHAIYEYIILKDNYAQNQNASKRKMQDKMKQPIEILIKLKLMFTSYSELFNGSVTGKVMRSF